MNENLGQSNMSKDEGIRTFLAFLKKGKQYSYNRIS